MSERERLAKDFASAFTDCTDKGLYNAFLQLYDAGAESRQAEVDKLDKKTYAIDDLYKEALTKLQAAEAKLKELHEFIANDVAPSWLPEGVRMRRNQLLRKIGETHE